MCVWFTSVCVCVCVCVCVRACLLIKLNTLRLKKISRIGCLETLSYNTLCVYCCMHVSMKQSSDTELSYVCTGIVLCGE